MVSKIEVWKKRMSPKESGNEDLDLDLTRLVQRQVPRTGIDDTERRQRAETVRVTLAEAMILNVPPASGPHHCSPANLAP